MESFASQDPRSYSSYFDLNIWFPAGKVTGTFDKRAPGSTVGIKEKTGSNRKNICERSEPSADYLSDRFARFFFYLPRRFFLPFHPMPSLAPPTCKCVWAPVAAIFQTAWARDHKSGSVYKHRGKTQCAWAQNLTSGQFFISGLVYKPIA